MTLARRIVSWLAVMFVCVSVAAACDPGALKDGFAPEDPSSPPPTFPPTPAGPAELPRQYINSDYVAATGATITVPAGGDFQAALDQAQPGDEIVLAAGATYTGNFVLSAKQGTGWIVIRSSELSQLPAPGRRVSPSDAARMPKLVSDNAAPALTAAERVHHYRVVGVEITSAPSTTLTYNIVSLGGNQEAPADMPHDLIFDRVYVHGHPSLDTQRCFAVNGGATAIVDSYVSECHMVGFDSQAIGGWRGTGPYKVVNNYLEGAGENLMFGGAGFSPAWDVAADVEIRGNYFFKPLSWNRNHPTYAGTRWSVKNLFEIKDGQRWLVEANIFENNWVDGQNGFAILYQAVDGVNAKITDITFRYNIVRYSPGGINCCARHDNTGTRGLPSEPLQRIAFEHNLFYDIGVDAGVLGSNGRAVQLLGDHRDTSVRHNTFFAPYSAMVLDGGAGTAQRTSVMDNIFERGQYGVTGNGTGEGLLALDVYLPGAPFVGNVLWGNASVASRYPAGNFFPAGLGGVGFVGGGDFRLAPSSPYIGAASDGTNPGADFGAIQARTTTARTGQ